MITFFGKIHHMFVPFSWDDSWMYNVRQKISLMLFTCKMDHSYNRWFVERVEVLSQY